MKGKNTVKIALIVLVAVIVVGFALAKSSTLKATDTGDAHYGDEVETTDATQSTGTGTTEYVEIPAPTVARSVEIYSEFVGGTFTGFGTQVVMTAVLTGYEDASPAFQWQYTADNGATWNNVEGANGQTYTFEITEENYTYSWRVEVQA